MKTKNDVAKIYNKPLMSLMDEARKVHKSFFQDNTIQASQLLSIKTGGCPEDCSYCPQSAHYETGVEKEALMSVERIKAYAKKAKESGATRLCMGAAWRQVKDGKEFDQVLEAITTINSLELEVCCTLGMINKEQAIRLKQAGLYAYNHNIDTSKDYYSNVISTRDYEARIETIENVRNAGITVCTGGILGLGETDEDRISFLFRLASFTPVPESITINTLVKVAGTPMEDAEDLDPSILLRVIATARILMPKAMIRLSAGRNQRTYLEQLLCFYVGANSIFFGEKLLTSPNPSQDEDLSMLKSFGINLETKNA